MFLKKVLIGFWERPMTIGKVFKALRAKISANGHFTSNLKTLNRLIIPLSELGFRDEGLADRRQGFGCY